MAVVVLSTNVGCRETATHSLSFTALRLAGAAPSFLYSQKVENAAATVLNCLNNPSQRMHLLWQHRGDMAAALFLGFCVSSVLIQTLRFPMQETIKPP